MTQNEKDPYPWLIALLDGAAVVIDAVAEAIRVFVARALAAAFITVIFAYAFIHNNDVLRPLPAWGTMVILPALGVLLFWFRARFRLVYGLTEFGVGAVTAIRVFWPAFNYATVQVVGVLQMLGGIYIMVRGCENVGKGLPPEMIPRWNKVFPS
jgi:hypothetical protein